MFCYNVVVLGEIADQNKVYDTGRDMENNQDLPNNGELFEGDIIMDSRLRGIVGHEQSKKSALLYHGFLDVRWPNGIVFYTIDSSFTPYNRILLSKAIHELHRRTCIRFRRRYKEPNFVVFSSRSRGCFSNVGMRGGRQTINLGSRCAVLGTTEHEVMHALGIVHEHSRPDRDLYLKVNFANVQPRDLRNFAKYRVYEINNLHQGFNFASVMLYNNYAFSRNGHRTIEAKERPKLAFGQRRQFSEGDIREINTLYECRAYLSSPDYQDLVKDIHLKAMRSEYIPIGVFETYMSHLQKLLENVQLSFVF